MRRTILATALILSMPVLPLSASASELSAETRLGTSVEEVKASLAGLGYEVRKAEMEDGKIEVYVVKDNKMSEIYVSPSTGLVTRIKMK